MGMPKWQLQFQGRSFLDIVVDNLKQAGLDDLVAVVRNGSVPDRSDIKIIINPKPENGMISSVYYGVLAAIDAEGYMIYPVDHPFVAADSIGQLLRAFESSSEAVIRPRFKDRSGHPIIIPKQLARQIKSDDYQGGLKQFLFDRHVKINYLDVDDNKVLKNINLPSDLLS